MLCGRVESCSQTTHRIYWERCVALRLVDELLLAKRDSLTELEMVSVLDPHTY